MQKRFLFILIILFSVLPQKTESHPPLKPGLKQPAFIESELRENLIDFAKKYLGTPYKYAGSNPEKGFDCSGFVSYVFRNFEIELPHSSKSMVSVGNEKKPEDFKVGDIIVFYGYRNHTQPGHVGIICEADGMNSKFIHSSSGKVKGVIISGLNSEMYKRRFYKCVDVIGK